MQQLILGSFDSEWFKVHTQEQARLLTNPAARQLLEPFIGFERTVTQAAQEAGCSVQRLMYRVEQFKRAGLLLETRQQRRSGRPVRYYRAVADGFQIPFEFTPFADVEDMTARQYAPFDRLRNRASAQRAVRLGYQDRIIYRDLNTQEINSESAIAPERMPRNAWDGTDGNDVVLIARLSSEKARAFALEFGELYERIHAASLPESQGQSFLIHMGMIPVASDDREW